VKGTDAAGNTDAGSVSSVNWRYDPDTSKVPT
jgi:hypothetical protein